LGDVAFRDLDRWFLAVADGLVETDAEALDVLFFPDFASLFEFWEPSPFSADLFFFFFLLLLATSSSSSSPADNNSTPSNFSNTEVNPLNTLVIVGVFLSPIRTIDCTMFLNFTMNIDCSSLAVSDPPRIDNRRLQFRLSLFSVVGFSSLPRLSDVKDVLIWCDDDHDGRGDIIVFALVTNTATIKDSRRYPPLA